MGAAAYRRGSRAISAQIDRELEAKRVKRVCEGTLENTANKRWAFCSECGRVDYEANEGDRCCALV